MLKGLQHIYRGLRSCNLRVFLALSPCWSNSTFTMRPLSLSYLLTVFQIFPCSSLALHAVFPLVTKAPFLIQPSNILEPRAISTELSTCGYLDGDPKKKRTADSGFNCRVDTRNGLWGFCPATVLTASDCGLAGSCCDHHDCSDGCGMTGSKGLTTFTWCALLYTKIPEAKC